jgi:hypothetical protein
VCTGTIAELDVEDQLGLIDSDDGRIMPFHLKGLAPEMRARFAVGRRVRFVKHDDRAVERATALVLIDGENQAFAEGREPAGHGPLR